MNVVQNISFAHPHFLWLLCLIPVFIFWQWHKKAKQTSTLHVSTLQGLEKMPIPIRVKFRFLIPLLRIVCIVCLVIALARPQKSNVTESVNSEGIDIILSMDISGSMLAEDFKPNRIEASKKVALEFILNRPTDRIGLVIFSGESFTQCPITTDQGILQQQILAIKSGLLLDGTAIGMGLATAVDRLRTSKAKSKIIILLTDGVNNTGLIDPVTALEIAKAYKIRVYTIGIGTNGSARYPVQDPLGNITMQQMPVQIDEVLLQKIARETRGKYYRAINNNALKNVYNEIDKLEKTKIEINSFKRYKELFFPFAFVGIIALFLEIILKYFLLRSFP